MFCHAPSMNHTMHQQPDTKISSIFHRFISVEQETPRRHHAFLLFSSENCEIFYKIKKETASLATSRDERHFNK